MIRANQLIRGESQRARAQFRSTRDKNMSPRAKKNSIATRNRHVSFCNAPKATRARHDGAGAAHDDARAPIGLARVASVCSWNRLQNKASS
jgi:hypothetical protein